MVLRPSDDDPGRAPEGSGVDIPAYEKQLADDPRWALSEGSRHFKGSGAGSRAGREARWPEQTGNSQNTLRRGGRHGDVEARFAHPSPRMWTSWCGKEDLKRIHREAERFGLSPCPSAQQETSATRNLGCGSSSSLRASIRATGQPKNPCGVSRPASGELRVRRRPIPQTGQAGRVEAGLREMTQPRPAAGPLRRSGTDQAAPSSRRLLPATGSLRGPRKYAELWRRGADPLCDVVA